MAKKTYFFSTLLILLGVVSYFMTGRESVTALIPAFLGVLLMLCGVISLNPNWTKHVMHAGVLLTLVGIIGSISGIPATIKLIFGGEVARPEAAISKTIMAVLCIWYFILCFRWFLSNRRAKSPKMIV